MASVKSFEMEPLPSIGTSATSTGESSVLMEPQASMDSSLAPHSSNSSSGESSSSPGNNTTRRLTNDENGQQSSTNSAQMGSKKRRKKRPTGVFKCDFETCDKTFTRAEHLARHKLNHNPTVIYRCPWDNCTKSFVRSDLRERHVKRHEMRKLKDEAKALNAALNGGSKKRRRKATDQIAKKPLINSLDSIILPNIEDGNPVNIHNYEHHHHQESTHRISAAADELNALQSAKEDTKQRQGDNEEDSLARKFVPNANDNFLTTSPQITTPLLKHHSALATPPPTESNSASSTAAASSFAPPSLSQLNSQNNSNNNAAASPATLINWLFDENQINNDLGGVIDSVPNLHSGNFFNPDDDPFGLSSDLLNDILVIPPNFPSPAQQTLVTHDIIQNLIKLVPGLQDNEYLGHIDHFLDSYWNSFHIQYPILHKPSFSTYTCPPILLLSMIMIGASYCTSLPTPKFNINARKNLGDLIADPLRFIIFGHEEFQPPSPVWMIQSLLLLEHYERMSSNRKLHERAFVHHGTTIQLLRRSPGLGGNPMNNKVDYNNNKQTSAIWEKWIEFETLKRTALFAFYIDATHSIVFGYHLMLFNHQIQLSLPCDEELWESYLTPKELPNKSEQMPFLVGLKKLLNREHVQTSRFGKKILLSGLLTMMFQMQQRDLQGSILEFDQLRDTWKDSLSLAFDYWNCDMMNGCCNTSSTVYWKDVDRKHVLPLTLRETDTRCKFPVYHMAQITLRIQHYDYYIYSGAPWRMNVKADNSDYELVEKKIKEWATSNSGRISVIYGYMFLFEMFLSPQDSALEQIDYKGFAANDEAVYERLNVLALVMLLIWSYVYNLDGPESRVYLNNPDETSFISREDGYAYLRRIRDDFTKLTGEQVHLSRPGDSVKYHQLIRLTASKLPYVKNKHHITGLLRLVSGVFKDSYWEVGNEFSRLINNCCMRSFGSSKIRCDDMYKSRS